MMAFLFSPFFLKIAGCLILAAVVGWAIHEALEHFREEGRTEQQALDAPVIAQLRGNVATLEANQAQLQAQIASQNAQVATWQAQAKASYQQAQEAVARAAATAKAYQGQIDGLTAIANGPRTVSFDAACKEAQSLIAGLIEGAR
jgi:uncharacterized protein involved in exopolysaccharide biosynthesis